MNIDVIKHPTNAAGLLTIPLIWIAGPYSFNLSSKCSMTNYLNGWTLLEKAYSIIKTSLTSYESS
jgi:hypothetical protein